MLQALEYFDCVKTEGMKHAKKCCHHFNMGPVQFSPELSLWHKHHTLWQHVLQWQAGHLVKAKYIQYLVSACHIVNPLGYSPLQATQVLRMAMT